MVKQSVSVPAASPPLPSPPTPSTFSQPTHPPTQIPFLPVPAPPPTLLKMDAYAGTFSMAARIWSKSSAYTSRWRAGYNG